MIDAIAIGMSKELSQYAAVTLDSLSRNMEQKLDVYIMQHDLTLEDKKLLADAWPGRMHFIDAGEIVDQVKKSSALSCPPMLIGRWMALGLLPSEVHTVLFLEVDLMVVGNIDALMVADYSQHIVYGISVMVPNFFRERIGLSDEEPYLNAGVVVANIDKIKESRFAENIFKEAECNLGEFVTCDETAFNSVCAGDKGILPMEFDMISAFFYYSYEDYLEFHTPAKKWFYTREEYENARLHPKIIHFTTGFDIAKPWYSNSLHPYAEAYREAMKGFGIAMRGYDNRSLQARFMSAVYLKLKDPLRSGLRDIWTKFNVRKISRKGSMNRPERTSNNVISSTVALQSGDCKRVLFPRVRHALGSFKLMLPLGSNRLKRVFSIIPSIFANRHLFLNLWSRGNYVADSVDLIVTTKCTLCCEKCISLLQYYDDARDVPLEILFRSIDKYFDCVYGVCELRVLGGEPFLYKDLDKVLNKLLEHSSQVGKITIVTNGTLSIKNDDLIKVLRHSRIGVLISGYKAAEDNRARLIEQLKSNKIRYLYAKDNHWQDAGLPTKRNRTDEELDIQYINCGKTCRSIIKGKMHVCPRSSHAMDLGFIEDTPEDYVDLLDGSISQDELCDQVIDLYTRKSHIAACDHCDFGTSLAKPIPTGTQCPRGTFHPPIACPNNGQDQGAIHD